MGWSCSHKAGNVLRAWGELCSKQTNTSNVFISKEKKYFFEVSNIEHHDGAITGSVFQMLPDGKAKKSGAFRIEPDGKISRGPAILKNYSVKDDPYRDGAIGSGGL